MKDRPDRWSMIERQIYPDAAFIDGGKWYRSTSTASRFTYILGYELLSWLKIQL
jgi:hypothetical protein